MKLPNFNFFEKSFVSLVISPRVLKAIKINVKSNTVVKFAQQPLAPGIIMNYRVKDKEALVAAIGELWAKNKFRDKYVGVVVPEFSTYTKSFTLPNISDVEIREALSYNLQEFLPTSIEEVVFDWKIIKREKDKAHVSAVAILKDVLFGYIDAVGASGLSPLVVETPSLSIQRILDGDEGGKLLIYVNTGEAILVISAGGEIIATSVVTSSDFNVIVSTARQMLTHYASVSVQKVVVAGVGITQDLIQFLNYNLGRSVQFGSQSVKGLLPGQVQDFLIGISLQKKNPVEPVSELTINLLPPSWAEFYKKQSTGIHAWSLSLIVSVVVWSTFLFVFSVYMFMNIQIQNLQNTGAVAKSQQLNEVANEVKVINSLSQKVLDFNNNTIYPAKILNVIKPATPGGIIINGYNINFQTGEVIIRGSSDSRNSLLAFKNSIEQIENVESINLPLASLVVEGSSTFDLSFFYKPLIKTKSQPAKLKLN